MVILYHVLIYLYKKRYGGGPPLPRQVIMGWNSNFVVEARLLTLKVCKSSSIEEFCSIIVSKATTVGEFKTKICQQMNLNPDNILVWDYYNNKKYKLLSDLTQMLQSYQILNEQMMLLEEQ